jgi:hypothetical protein
VTEKEPNAIALADRDLIALPHADGLGVSGLAGVGRGAACRPTTIKGLARALSGGRDDLLTGEYPGRQRQEQRPEPDRADYWWGVGTLDRPPRSKP